MTHRTLRLAQGFALMEALIAAAVLAFGLLAVAKFEFSLFGSSDLAKQRSEAVQLGEQKIEALRAFSLLTAYQGIASSSDTVPGGSASYTRTWTIADSPITVVGGTYPIYKDVAMTVSWVGRSNATESIKLNSVIAMSDPAAAGQVVVPPAGSPIRQPKSRAINIPWQAVRLGNGTSAFHPPGSATGFAIIFDDLTAAVTSTCVSATLPSSDNMTSTPTDTTGWGCTSVNGLFLAGYIGVSSSNPPPINFHVSVTPAANTSVSGTATLLGCWDDIGPSGTGAQVYTDYVTYACVLNVTGSNGTWSGTTRFTGETFATPPVTVSWGTSNGTWKVCRYSSSGVAYPYVDVNKSIEVQNYILKTGNAPCPTGTSQSFP